MKTFKDRQKIIVFQQNHSAEFKIAGIQEFGNHRYELSIVSIDDELPTIIDHTDRYLPEKIEADLVLDFLEHPDLSYDLALMARKLDIPVVASGKKILVKGVSTPPT